MTEGCKVFVYCNGREYYDLDTPTCPRDGYRNPLQGRLASLVAAVPAVTTYEDLAARCDDEEVLLSVLLVGEHDRVATVMPASAPLALGLINERNRVILRLFPGGRLAQALAQFPSRSTLPHVPGDQLEP